MAKKPKKPEAAPHLAAAPLPAPVRAYLEGASLGSEGASAVAEILDRQAREPRPRPTKALRAAADAASPSGGIMRYHAARRDAEIKEIKAATGLRLKNHRK